MCGLFALAACTADIEEEAVDTDAMTAPYVLKVSASASRSSAAPLNGARVSGLEYVFTTTSSGATPTGISSIQYWLDNALVTTEHSAPFDFMGTADNGTSNPWDTKKLASGTHTIRQVVTPKGAAAQSFTATFTVGTVAGGGSGTAPDAGSSGSIGTTQFPRLGGMLIGNPKNYGDTTYQAQIARLDLAVLGIYEGWRGNGKTPAQAVSEIRARNPNIRLANYTIMTEVYSSATDAATTALRTKLSSEKGPNGVGDWWAYNSAGAHTDWSGGTYGAWDTNLTLLTKPDANGDHWPQWLAQQQYTHLLANAGFDAWYCDNNFWKPRVDADWNRDGANDSQNNVTVRNWFRDGQRAYYDRAKAIAPKMSLMVNADSDLSGAVYPAGSDKFTQFTKVVHGGFMEHAIGKSWSVETWGGFNTVLGWYRSLKTNLLDPNGAMLDVYLSSTTDYQTLRYSFALTLLDDGYFSVSTDYNKILWFDEFDLAGKGTTKWLGAPIDPPPTAPFQNGVWRRRFEHGMAIVNPKGNGSRTITIESGYKRIAGTQAPTVNNGSAASTITLADRDGLLLVHP